MSGVAQWLALVTTALIFVYIFLDHRIKQLEKKIEVLESRLDDLEADKEDEDPEVEVLKMQERGELD